MYTFIRSKKSLLLPSLLIAIILFSLFQTRSLASAQEAAENFWRVRSIYTADYGIQNPSGFAFSPAANAFLVIPEASGTPNTNIDLIAINEDPAGFVSLEAALDAPLNLAFNDKTGSLFSLERDANELVEIKTDNRGRPNPSGNAITRFDTRAIGTRDPQGVTFDPESGRLFILDSVGPRILSIAPHPAQGFDGDAASRDGKIRRIDLNWLKQASLRGIAYNPGNSHLYVSNPDEHTVYELTETGLLVSTFDLTALRLINPQAMLFAPSGDATDNPGTLNLFILDSGQTTGQKTTAQSGQIVELSLVAPEALPAGTTLLSSSLVHTIDASNAAWSPSAPDTSGIDYWPLNGRLLISDSEVDAMPAYFTGKNVFSATLSGTLVSTCSTTNLSRTGFSNEPTGVGINPNNNRVYFTDDDKNAVMEVGLGPDGVYCTSDDTLTSINVLNLYGIDDAEDVAYGNNSLYIAGGTDAEVYQFSLGANGVLGGGDDGAMTHFDTAALGFNDLEGIGYNASQGTLFIVSATSSEKYLGETTTSGTLVRAYDLSYLPTSPRSDVAYAPGSGNSAVKNIYIVSRGIDNANDPNENDGKVWEISIGAPQMTFTPSRTPTRTPTSTNTRTSTPTPTYTRTPTPTPTHTRTPTLTPTYTRTPTPTPSNTPTYTPTLTFTPSNTPTYTPTLTFTPSNTPTHTPPLTFILNSIGANDGWVLASTEAGNQGGRLNATATTFYLGDNVAYKQYRGILHFDTSGLPDTAVIITATLKIKRQGLSGTNPFSTRGNILVDIRKGAFGNNAALQIGDFQAGANKNSVGVIKNTPVGSWYSANLLNISSFINKTGTTQLRLRFMKNDNRDKLAGFIKFYSGNAGAANRPQLIVEYYIP